MDVDKIDDDIKLLLVIAPKDISDKAQYAIDQFIMRGGKLVAFLDPQCLADNRQQNQMMANMGGGGFLARQAAQGLGHSVRHRQGRGRHEVQDAVARAQRRAAGRAGLAGPDARTASTRMTWPPARSTTSGCRLCGAFTGTPVAGLKETVLLHSSKDSQLVDAMLANLSGENIMKEFKPSGVNYNAGDSPDRQVQDRLPRRRAAGQEGRKVRHRQEGREEAGGEESRRLAQGDQRRQHRGAVWRRRSAL